jgi:outer membrane protein insertion porin family
MSRWFDLFALLLLAGCGSVPIVSDLGGPKRGFDLVLEGNASLGDGPLTRAIAFDLGEFEDQGFSRPAADDAAFALEVYYRGLGFHRAQVSWRIEDAAPGERPRLVLAIDEGPRATIDEKGLAVSGVSAFEQAEVGAFFNGPRLGNLGRGDLLYIDDRVRAVPGRMVDEYVFRGYLDAQVDPIKVRLDPEGTRAQLTLTVREGERYHVGRVRFAPGTGRALESEVSARIFDRYRRADDQPRVFDPRLPFELRGELKEELALIGRPESVVKVETYVDREAPGGPRVDLTVSMRPGPRVVLAGLRFAGNELTDAAFLESRLRLEPGDPFSSLAARQSIARLYQTGLFKSVELSLVAPAEGTDDGQGDQVRRDLLVTVEEGPTREYWAEAGWGSYELLRLRIGARERNIFGSGRQVRATATAALRAQRARVELLDPWLFDTELIGRVPLIFERRENPSFTSREASVGLLVTKEWQSPGFRKVATTFGYRFRRSEVLNIDAIDTEVLNALDRIDISSLTISQAFDHRDQLVLPRRGSLLNAELEWGARSIGSELDFLRFTLSLARYVELIEDELVLATALRTGVISPQGDDDSIPLQERYFNGGENTVRSFKEDDLGPTDSAGNAVGGEARTVLNIELRKRLMPQLELAVFADAGDVVARSEDWLRYQDVRAGFGLGLRYMLPIGPIRFDLGLNPNPRPGEDEVVPHIALGLSF